MMYTGWIIHSVYNRKIIILIQFLLVIETPLSFIYVIAQIVEVDYSSVWIKL